MSKKFIVAEQIAFNRKRRNASALVGSRFEFENNLDIIEEEIELNNLKYDLDVEAEEIIENILETRENFLNNNLEFEKEIFERELADWACNTPVSWTKKSSIKVDIDSISGTLKSAKNCEKFSDIFLKNYEEEEGIFNFNYQQFQKKIISNGLVLFKNRINKDTGEIEDIIYFSWNGESCRNLDYILWQNDTNWIEFIKEIVVLGDFKVTRIDGAMTSVGNLLKLSTIKRKLERGEYKGHFKNKPTVVSSVGETYYLGYGQDCLIRFYDKKIETILKHKLRALEYLTENYPEVTRIELQMRNKYAQAFIDDLLKYQYEENVIQETIRSWICKKVTFLSEFKEDEIKKSRVPIAPFWRELADVKLEVKATYERKNLTIEDSMMHVVRNDKSLTAMYFIKKYYEETKKEPSNSIFKKMMERSFSFLENENYYVTKEMYNRLIIYAQIEEDEDLLRLIKEKLIVV